MIKVTADIFSGRPNPEWVSAGKPDFYQSDRPMAELGPEDMEKAGMHPGPPAVQTRGCARILTLR